VRQLTGEGSNDIVAPVNASLAVLGLFGLLAALPSTSGSALAGERVAVAVFAVTGQTLAPESQAKLRGSLRGGLAAAGFDVVPDADVDKAIAANGLGGCDTLPCMRRIGELVLARRVIKASIEVIGNTHVVSQLELVDLADGKTAASAKDNCDVCTMKEVNDGLSNAAAALRMQVEPSTPTGGVAAAAPAEAPSRRTLWIGLTGASAAVLVAGIVTFAISYAYDGRTNCGSELPAGDQCPTSYRGTPGIALGAVGMAAGAVGVGLFGWKAVRSAPARKVALVPSLGLRTAALDLAVRW
jgi:hypothetical protein